jgi:hypothetical protein
VETREWKERKRERRVRRGWERSVEYGGEKGRGGETREKGEELGSKRGRNVMERDA